MRVVSTMQYRNLLEDLEQQKERIDRAQRSSAPLAIPSSA